MKIKTQKILRFIPIVNFVIMFIWIGMYFKYSTKQSQFIINLLKMFAGIITINIPRFIINKLDGEEILIQLAYYMTVYLTFFWIAYIAVKDQIRIMERQEVI